MKTPERITVAIGTLLIAYAVLVNEYTLSSLSPDGSFEGSTLALMRICGALALAGGLGALAGRRHWPALLASWRPLRPDGPALRNILLLGVFVRIAVYVFLEPHNNDPHYAFVRFIVDNKRLPFADEVTTGFHPPLYYLCAALPAAFGGDKLVQALSLAFSLVHFWLLHRLLGRTSLLGRHATRCHALLLAALAPQFVLFESFISNDTLAFLVGTLIFLQTFRTIEHPCGRNHVLLGTLVGIGLLTKGALIAFVPVLVLVVVVAALRAGRSPARLCVALLAFGLPAVLVGGYKFVENARRFGTPIVSNDEIHQSWVEAQMGTVTGWGSLLDVNVAKLVHDPFFGSHTRHSIPLLMYATLWSAHIKESSFNATRRNPWSAVPRLIYLSALLPTLLIVLGACVWMRRLSDLGRTWRAPPAVFQARLQELALGLVLALNLGLVLRWGIRHDAWSFFQGRLLFPSALALFMAFAQGLETLAARRPRLRQFAGLGLVVFYATCGAYFVIELGFAATS